MKLNIPPLSESRTREIIDAYGTRPACWPVDECQAALECLAQSQTLQDYCRQHEFLDKHIETAICGEKPDAHAMRILQQRILDELPTQQRHARRAPFAWMNPPRLALGGIGLLAVALLIMLHRPPAPPPNQADSAYEVWAWYDITGQDLAEDNTGTAMTMTDYIELDEPPGNS